MSYLDFPDPVEAQKIESLLHEIFFLSEDLKKTPLTFAEQKKISRDQIIRAAIYSSRLEGNYLTLQDAKNMLKSKGALSHKEQRKSLLFSNLVQTLRTLHTFPDITQITTIVQLHQMILDGLTTSAGSLRKKTSTLKDDFDAVLYETPSPIEMKRMLTTLLSKINTEQNTETMLVAAVQSHYYFLKIHPFNDGNGRVGRALLHHDLLKTDLFANFILPIDEYLAKNKADYYGLLERNSVNIDELCIFIFEGLVYSLKKLKNHIQSVKRDNSRNTQEKDRSTLLPRRRELLNIISDHPHSTLDSLWRRFPNTPRRTISYDLQCLARDTFIVKHGNTRGASYSEKKL